MLLCRLDSCQPAVELAVGMMENIVLQVVNNQVHSWLTTVYVVPPPCISNDTLFRSYKI